MKGGQECEVMKMLGAYPIAAIILTLGLIPPLALARHRSSRALCRPPGRSPAGRRLRRPPGAPILL